MKNIIINSKSLQVVVAIILVNIFNTSCNKPLPEATPIDYPTVNNSTTSIGDLISSDTSYSFFAAAATKTGQLAQLKADSTEYTVFLPTNNAFRASGIPSLDVVNALPVPMLAGIVGYSIIPGRQFLSTNISTAFPNEQLPTTITIGQLTGIPLPLKLSTFPSISGSSFYDNNIPVTKQDTKLKNGVIHEMAAIVAPPSQLLKQAIDNNPELAYFKMAIARADSGQTGLNRIDSLLDYAVTNMTVLAPNNAAFETFIFGTAYGFFLQGGYDAASASQLAATFASSPNVFNNPAFYGILPAATVRGIIVYHILASLNPNTHNYEPNIRVFSNNFPSTPTLYKTLVNSVYATHPGILAHATFTGLFVSDLKFSGAGTFPPGGTAFSDPPATAVSMDNHAVNGVYYVIDKVLLPK